VAKAGGAIDATVKYADGSNEKWDIDNKQQITKITPP